MKVEIEVYHQINKTYPYILDLSDISKDEVNKSLLQALFFVKMQTISCFHKTMATSIHEKKELKTNVLTMQHNIPLGPYIHAQYFNYEGYNYICNINMDKFSYDQHTENKYNVYVFMLKQFNSFNTNSQYKKHLQQRPWTIIMLEKYLQKPLRDLLTTEVIQKKLMDYYNKSNAFLLNMSTGDASITFDTRLKEILIQENLHTDYLAKKEFTEFQQFFCLPESYEDTLKWSFTEPKSSVVKNPMPVIQTLSPVEDLFKEVKLRLPVQRKKNQPHINYSENLNGIIQDYEKSLLKIIECCHLISSNKRLLEISIAGRRELEIKQKEYLNIFRKALENFKHNRKVFKSYFKSDVLVHNDHYPWGLRIYLFRESRKSIEEALEVLEEKAFSTYKVIMSFDDIFKFFTHYCKADFYCNLYNKEILLKDSFRINSKLIRETFKDKSYISYLDLNIDIDSQLYFKNLLAIEHNLSYKKKLQVFLQHLIKNQLKYLDNFDYSIYLDHTGGLLYITYLCFIKNKFVHDKHMLALASILTKFIDYLRRDVALEDTNILKKIIDVAPYKSIYKKVNQILESVKPNEEKLFLNRDLLLEDNAKKTYKEFNIEDKAFIAFINKTKDLFPQFSLATLINPFYTKIQNLTWEEEESFCNFFQELSKNDRKAKQDLEHKLYLDPTNGILYILYYCYKKFDLYQFKHNYYKLKVLLANLVCEVIYKTKHIEKAIKQKIIKNITTILYKYKAIIKKNMPDNTEKLDMNLKRHIKQIIAVYVLGPAVEFLYVSSSFWLACIIKNHKLYSNIHQPFESYLKKTISQNVISLLDLFFPGKQRMHSLTMIELQFYLDFLLLYAPPKTLLLFCNPSFNTLDGMHFICFFKYSLYESTNLSENQLKDIRETIDYHYERKRNASENSLI